MPLAVAAVALTAGLAVATFVKAFGVGFLARPRSPEAAAATESPAGMLAGMGVAAAACVGAGAAADAGAARDRRGGRRGRRRPRDPVPVDGHHDPTWPASPGRCRRCC